MKIWITKHYHTEEEIGMNGNFYYWGSPYREFFTSFELAKDYVDYCADKIVDHVHKVPKYPHSRSNKEKISWYIYYEKNWLDNEFMIKAFKGEEKELPEHYELFDQKFEIIESIVHEKELRD